MWRLDPLWHIEQHYDLTGLVGLALANLRQWS